MKMSRVTRSKKAAKSSYNRLGKLYDLFAFPFEKKFRNIGLQKLQVSSTETILEIGFGTGHAILEMAKTSENSGRVYGIDISERMCDISLSKVKKAGFSDRVGLVCGDAAMLPFLNNSFNAIFISFTLELFDTPEISMVLQECRRVLQKGGRLCVVSMNQKLSPSLTMRIYEWFHRKIPNYVDCRPIFVKELVEEGGFAIMDSIEIYDWGLSIAVVISTKVCRGISSTK